MDPDPSSVKPRRQVRHDVYPEESPTGLRSTSPARLQSEPWPAALLRLLSQPTIGASANRRFWGAYDTSSAPCRVASPAVVSDGAWRFRHPVHDHHDHPASRRIRTWRRVLPAA